MIDKDDCTFSGFFSGFILSFELFKWQKKSRRQKCWHDTMILLFTLAITSAFAECQRELERLERE